MHKHIDVNKAITVDMVTDGPAKGWVHTHGLAKFGRPELEIRAVPTLFCPSAGAILNEVADYMLNTALRPVRAGQTMELGRFLLLRFHPAHADDAAGYDSNHYEVQRLRVDALDMACECCVPKAKA
jgi:hypothetical protein